IDDGVPIERESYDLLVVAGHAADERVAVPIRKHVTLIERETRNADGWNEECHRLFHALFAPRGVNFRPDDVVRAVPDHRPTVVGTAADQIELVAALWTVLRRP